MATKKPQSRVSQTATKKSGFQLRWWMAVLLILVVAGIGIVVLRFSHAGTGKIWYAADSDIRDPDGSHPLYSRYQQDPLLPQPNTVLVGTTGNSNVLKQQVSELLPAGLGDFQICFAAKPLPSSGLTNSLTIQKFDNATAQFKNVVYYATAGNPANTTLIVSNISNVSGYRNYCAVINRKAYSINDGDLVRYVVEVVPSFAESPRLWKIERGAGTIK